MLRVLWMPIVVLVTKAYMIEQCDTRARVSVSKMALEVGKAKTVVPNLWVMTPDPPTFSQGSSKTIRKHCFYTTIH